MKEKVLVVGSIAIDDVTTPYGRRKKSLGGSAIYFSIACSLFSPVSIIGVVGKDYPLNFLRKLEKRNIDTKGIKIEKGKTFFWKGKYDFDLNKAITLKTELNVFSKFKPELLDYQRDIKYLFLANISPSIQMAVIKKMKNAKVIAADTMNFWIDNSKKELVKMLKYIDFLIINDAETRQLGESSNLIKAAKKILAYGVKTLIIKQGEYGVCMFYKDKKGYDFFSIPAFPLEQVLDPTGAGDSFAGGFMGYIASKDSINRDVIKNAVVIGSVLASFTVEDFSVDNLLKVKMADIKNRYEKLHKISYFEKMKF